MNDIWQSLPEHLIEHICNQIPKVNPKPANLLEDIRNLSSLRSKITHVLFDDSVWDSCSHFDKLRIYNNYKKMIFLDDYYSDYDYFDNDDNFDNNEEFDTWYDYLAGQEED